MGIFEEFNFTSRDLWSRQFAMSEETSSPDQTKDSFQDQFESLEIPTNIDPRLLALWLERERAEIAKSQTVTPRRYQAPKRRRLTRLFAAYIGIVVMCLMIVLGMIQGKEAQEILGDACRCFLIYAIFGFFIGWIAEYCVTDSVETLLREIVRRSDEAATTAEQSGEAQPSS